MIEPHRIRGLGYRADIDGLRAVAIVPVVFYHAQLPLFDGGFVGVDIFFVISGYLITSFIIVEVDSGTFSLFNFYLRRIRRIFPALLLMMASCAVIGWLWLSPRDYKLMGQSILAASLFSSNILFWRESGYFEVPLEDRPLLHTWSLGVEEQFYFVFPVLLIFICRFFPRRRIAIILLLCALSFSLNVLFVRHHPEAAFYLAPFRIWELFVGSLIAMGAIPSPRNIGWGDRSSIMGIIMIIVAIFAFSKQTPFPGLAAVLPTLGAAAVIWGGMPGQGRVKYILSQRAPVFIGKISYSLYLWHFPLLAFGAYFDASGLRFLDRIGLVALTLVLAVGSWLWVEQPVHRGHWPFKSHRAVFGTAIVALIAFSGFGFAMNLADGFPSRLTKHDLEILAASTDFNPDRSRCLADSVADIASTKVCKFGVNDAAPEFALWGDSHAEALRAAIDQAAEKAQRSGIFLGHSGCIPEIGIERSDIPGCRSVNDAIVAYLVGMKTIRTVILAGRWGLWAEGSRYKREVGPPVTLVDETGVPINNHTALASGLERAIAALVASGKQVWLVGPIPEVGYEVPRAIYIDSLGIAWANEIRPTFEEFNFRQRFVLALFREMTEKYLIRVVWPHQALCDKRFCQVQKNDRPLYIDSQHLTRSGAKSITEIFDPIFR